MKKRLLSALVLSVMIVSLSASVAPCFGAKTERLETESTTVQEENVEVYVEKNDISNTTLGEEISASVKKKELKNGIEIAIEQMNKEMAEIENFETKYEWYIAYKEIVEKYSYVLDPPETIYDYYTTEEIHMIQKCVETECFEASFDAKVNVARTILNRVEHEDFSDDVIEVITGKNQFVYGRNNITKDTVLAVEYAFEIGSDFEGSLYFHSLDYMETFNNANYIGTDGYHYFYK